MKIAAIFGSLALAASAACGGDSPPASTNGSGGQAGGAGGMATLVASGSGGAITGGAAGESGTDGMVSGGGGPGGSGDDGGSGGDTGGGAGGAPPSCVVDHACTDGPTCDDDRLGCRTHCMCNAASTYDCTKDCSVTPCADGTACGELSWACGGLTGLCFEICSCTTEGVLKCQSSCHTPPMPPF